MTNEDLLNHTFQMSSVIVSREEENCDLDALGIKLTNEELAGLCGAPSGSNVQARLVMEPAQETSEVNGKKKSRKSPPVCI
jgi:hypothetical protein